MGWAKISRTLLNSGQSCFQTQVAAIGVAKGVPMVAATCSAYMYAVHV